MEKSILISTKKILGLSAEYTPFDLDIITHINMTFAVLNQLGVGPTNGFYIEDSIPTWDNYQTTDSQTTNLVKTYVFLKVKSLFDPPTNSFLAEAFNKQINEIEWRLNVIREGYVTT